MSKLLDLVGLSAVCGAAFLVAPPDVELHPDVPEATWPFRPIPRDPLPFPSMLVASSSDPSSSSTDDDDDVPSASLIGWPAAVQTSATQRARLAADHGGGLWAVWPPLQNR